MEHEVPEQMFSTEDNPAQGISAVKALALAMAEGQKVWQITRDNVDAALVAIQLDREIEAEIRNAVNAGQQATAHERPVAFAGGTNVGYILLDPETGGGAYKISGGGNGGFLKGLLLKLQFWIGAFLSLTKNNIVAKFITKAFGQFFTIFSNAYRFITECSSLDAALALTLVFTLISVAIAIALFFIAGPAALFLSVILAVAEDRLAKFVISKGC